MESAVDEQIAQQIGLGALAVILGLSGWLLPFKWNLLRLRRGMASLVPEHINRMIPKIVGSILGIVGIAVLVGTAAVGRFQ